MDERIDPKYGAFCLACIGINATYFLSVIRKQKKTIEELAAYGKDIIRIAEEGRYILDSVVEDVDFSEEAYQRINDKITLYKLDYELMQEPGIAEKTSLLMRSSPHNQGDTMTDQTVPTPAVVDQTPPKAPSRLRQFTANHPKITNAAKLTAGAVGIIAVTRAVTNAQHNKERLQEGLDHAKEAGDALTDSVTLDTES